MTDMDRVVGCYTHKSRELKMEPWDQGHIRKVDTHAVFLGLPSARRVSGIPVKTQLW